MPASGAVNCAAGERRKVSGSTSTILSRGTLALISPLIRAICKSYAVTPSTLAAPVRRSPATEAKAEGINTTTGPLIIRIGRDGTSTFSTSLAAILHHISFGNVIPRLGQGFHDQEGFGYATLGSFHGNLIVQVLRNVASDACERRNASVLAGWHSRLDRLE
jgi:hypothetical protein